MNWLSWLWMLCYANSLQFDLLQDVEDSNMQNMRYKLFFVYYLANAKIDLIIRDTSYFYVCERFLSPIKEQLWLHAFHDFCFLILARLTYSDLCLRIPESNFRQCLLATLSVLFKQMCSYYSIMSFQLDENVSFFLYTVTFLSIIFFSFFVENIFWQEIKLLLCDFWKYDAFIILVDIFGIVHHNHMIN